jgi:FMN phosphatase YigB (HAD superfamily)
VSETLERFGLRHYFSAIVVSREFGWLKPHPSIYKTGLKLRTSFCGISSTSP